MITSLRGRLQGVGERELILEVGGVGLAVFVPPDLLEKAPAIGQSMFLHTALVVRADSLSLYGFSQVEQRELFQLLLQVSGIGPRTAFGLVSHLSPDVFRSAVGNNQPEALTRVPGIGKKTAEKIVFQLKDKLAAPAGIAVSPSETDVEVLALLTGLGYSVVEAQTALQSIPRDAPAEVEERLRLALRYFARP